MSCISHRNEHDHHMQESFIYRPSLSLEMCSSMIKYIVELKPRCSPLCFFFKEALGNQICCVGNRHRTNTKNLTRYLWKMTCCLPLHWVQRTDAKLSSHILHTGQRTVKLRRISEKHVAPLRGEGHYKIESDSSYAASEWHLHFAAPHAISFKTSCLFWAEQFHEHSWSVVFLGFFFCFQSVFTWNPANHSTAVWYPFLWLRKRRPFTASSRSKN